MSRVRLVPILLIAVITLAVLFGGWQAYQHYNLLQPLQTNLKRISGVQSVEIWTKGSRVTVKLGPVNTLQNHDLQQTYRAIEANIQNALGTGETPEVTSEDTPSATLQSAMESYYMILRESVQKGDFVEMVPQVETLAAKAGITAKITMDDHNFYIQLSKGSSYLYEIMAYTLPTGGGTA